MGTAEQEADRADQVAGLLPRYSRHAHKDPRAPQNLYPVAGLEREPRIARTRVKWRGQGADP